MSEQNKDQVIEVTAKDLPLYCPGPNSTRWNMHPRVFLDIAEAKDHLVTCPYCSTKYQLKAGEKIGHHSH